MKINIISTLVAFFIIANVYSQSNLNDYKYVIVPNKFDFLKEENQYRLNELSAFLFKKHGFIAIMEGNEYPEDLMLNRCLALYPNVFKESGLLKTKLVLKLKDCNSRLVYTKTGDSREKEYKKAYNEAMRAAFKPFEFVNYKYKPKKGVVSTVKASQKENTQEIEKLKQEIESLKKHKEVAEVKEGINTAVTERQSSKNGNKTEVVDDNLVQAPVISTAFPDQRKRGEVSKGKQSKGVLYAQKSENGFQLVDSSPKIIYKMKKTGLNDVFLVEDENGILYRKDNSWILEYYSNNILKQEKLNIKF